MSIANALSQLLPSVNVEIPPTHAAWRVYWTEEDNNALNDVEVTQANATQAMDESDPSSVEYWNAMRTYNKMELERAEIKWRLCQRVLGFNERRDDYQWLRGEFLMRRAELDDKKLFIERMAVEAGYRKSLLSLVKMEHGALPADPKEIVVVARNLMEQDVDPRVVQKLGDSLKMDYGVKTVGNSQLVWSPLEGDWRMEHEVKATHILPFTLGQDNEKYLSGQFPARLKSCTKGNGIFLPIPVADALEKNYVALAPVTIHKKDPDMEIASIEAGNAAPSDTIEYKLIVIDRPEIWDTLALRDTPFSALHGRVLQFHPEYSNRPNDYYVYLHFLISLLTFLRRLRVQGITEPLVPDITAIDELLQLWPSGKSQFGEALGKTMRRMVRTVGETHLYNESVTKTVFPVNVAIPTLPRVNPREFQRLLDMLAIVRLR